MLKQKKVFTASSAGAEAVLNLLRLAEEDPLPT
jgi:hypothetical protein